MTTTFGNELGTSIRELQGALTATKPPATDGEAPMDQDRARTEPAGTHSDAPSSPEGQQVTSTSDATEPPAAPTQNAACPHARGIASGDAAPAPAEKEITSTAALGSERGQASEVLQRVLDFSAEQQRLTRPVDENHRKDAADAVFPFDSPIAAGAGDHGIPLMAKDGQDIFPRNSDVDGAFVSDSTPNTPQEIPTPPIAPATEKPPETPPTQDEFLTPAYYLGRDAYRRLREGGMTDLERSDLIYKVLDALLHDQKLPSLAFSEICRSLHFAAPAEYSGWLGALMRQGIQYTIESNPATARVVDNVLLLQRPQLIAELGIAQVTDVAMLDTALAEFRKYVLLTAEVEADHLDAAMHGPRTAWAHIKSVSSMQVSLKTYLNTLQFLRCQNRRTPRVLNVKAGGNVAVQLNEAGSAPGRGERR